MGTKDGFCMQPLSANHYNTEVEVDERRRKSPELNLTPCARMGRQQVAEDPDCEGSDAATAQLEKLLSRQRPRLQRDAGSIPCSWC